MNFNIQYFRDAWRLFNNHMASLFVLTLTYYLALVAFTLLFSAEELQAVLMILFIVLEILFRAAIIILLMAWIRGERMGIWASYKTGSRFFTALLPVIMVTYILGVLGFLAFIIPCLLVFSRLGYAPFMVVLDGQDPMQALKKSVEATEKNYLEIIITAIIPWLVITIFSISLSNIVGNDAFIVKDLIDFLSTLIQVFFVLVLFRFYYAYKEEKT